MKKAGIAELKNNLSRYINYVKGGETVGDYPGFDYSPGLRYISTHDDAPTIDGEIPDQR